MHSTIAKTVAASSLLGALVLAVLGTATAQADEAKAMKPAMEKCFGVAKAGKNDCAAGAHSCAGQSTKDMDKTSFVSLPAGACSKLAGGSTTAGT